MDYRHGADSDDWSEDGPLHFRADRFDGLWFSEAELRSSFDSNSHAFWNSEPESNTKPVSNSNSDSDSYAERHTDLHADAFGYFDSICVTRKSVPDYISCDEGVV